MLALRIMTPLILLFIILSSNLWAETTNSAASKIAPILSILLPDDAPVPPASSLYVGYYYEDATTNPEDPTLGTVYLRIPNQDGGFTGSMSFTYFGCQSDSVGTITGTKSGVGLNSLWSGTIDGTNQSGSFTGAFTNDGRYQGVYDVTGGKQHIVIENCIDYYIAPNGFWVLYPVNSTISFDGTTAQTASMNNNIFTWYPGSSFAYSVVSIIDKQLTVNQAGNAILFQESIFTQTSTALPSNLDSGKTYVVSVAVVNDQGTVIYVSSIDYIKN